MTAQNGSSLCDEQIYPPIELPDGIACLSRGAYLREASLEMMLSILTESAAQMSGIARASIWALTGDHSELRCMEFYERGGSRRGKGESLKAERYPVYFDALRSGLSIAADNAAQHPLTREFAADYLPLHRVTARLDTPIHIRGELQGVFCLEQLGESQSWSSSHRLFAQAVANLVAMALIDYEAAEARRQAHVASERMRAVFDASRDALFLADGASGEILDLNRQAERLLDRSRADLHGQHYGLLHPKEERQRVAGEFQRLFDGQSPWALVTEVQRPDGRRVPVEVTAEVAELGNGRRLALSTLRPI